MRIVSCLWACLALAWSCRAGAEAVPAAAPAAVSAGAFAGVPATVRIAAEDDWPPYASAVGKEHRPEGFSVDLVREVFASQGVKVEFVVVPFARCLAYTLKGSVAGCFNVGMTTANRGDFIWPATPLLEDELSIFARSDAPGHPPSRELGAADLRHRTVGYTVGYTYSTELMTDPLITRYGASSDQQLLRMLVAGRVDYVLLNRLPATLRIESNPAFRGQVRRVGKVSMDSFWLAFSKAHPDGHRMSVVFERGLREFKRDGRYQAMTADFRRRLGL